MRRRWITVALLAPTLVLLVGLLRPVSGSSGLTPTLFWARKLEWGPDYDVVLAGDSRVYRALSPEEMRAALGNDVRIANYGFSGNGWTEAYVRAVTDLLDPRSPRPVVVLGVTPMSLTPLAAERNEFVELRRQGPLERRLDLSLSGFYHFFRPYDLTELRHAIAGDDEGYFQVYHPDGWVESWRRPEDPLHAVGTYRDRFEHNQVAPEIVGVLVDAVRHWTEAGIAVYAFRPPTSDAMLELEDRVSGFDEREIRRKLAEAGGVWLSFDDDYRSYDGSHLVAEAARQLSRDLARALAARPSRGGS